MNNNLTVFCPNCEQYAQPLFRTWKGCYYCQECHSAYYDLANARNPKDEKDLEEMILGQHWKVYTSIYKGTRLGRSNALGS